MTSRQRHRLQLNQDDDFWLRNLSAILQTQEESSRVTTYSPYSWAASAS